MSRVSYIYIMVIHQIFPQIPLQAPICLVKLWAGEGGVGRGNHLAEKELVRFPVKRDASRGRGERRHTRIIINDYFGSSVISGETKYSRALD